MTRTDLMDEAQADASLQCSDCDTLAPEEAPYCLACGGKLRTRRKSRIAYYSVAIFIAIGAAGAVILYWTGRAS